jgi:polyisoprenoid-binding protein YceI
MRKAASAACLLLLACLALCRAGLAAAQTRAFDPDHSYFGFELRPRIGQRLEGMFTRYEGTVQILPDGRHQVHLRMFADSAVIPGKPRYTGWMRGPDFFDAKKFPAVEFDSLPFHPEMLREGGNLPGMLGIRGVVHLETFQVLPSECSRPGLDCDVVARGNVQRTRYGMDNWTLALGDRVTLVLRSRLQEHVTP